MWPTSLIQALNGGDSSASPPRPSVPVTGQGILQNRSIVYRKLNHGSSVVQPKTFWLDPMIYAIISLPVFVACSNLRCVCADLETEFWETLLAQSVSASGA